MVPDYCPKCNGRLSYGSEIALIPHSSDGEKPKHDETCIWGVCEKCSATVTTFFREYKIEVEEL